MDELYKDGWNHYPLWWVFGANLFFFAIWTLGAWILFPLRLGRFPLATVIYLVLIVVFIWVFLKKHNCTTCYYYGKRCNLGWGRFTALFFKKDSGRPELGQQLSIIYAVLPLIPILGGIAVIFLYGFTWALLVALVLFVALNGIQFAVLRPAGCRHCKRRYTCLGSAAK